MNALTSRRHFLKSATAIPALAGSLTASAAPVGERVRVAQIGTEHGHAAGKMEALRRLSAIFEIVGLSGADADPGPAFDGVQRMEPAALLADPKLEAVVVETDFVDACATAHRFIKAGKHVHLDKPGALQHGEFKAMRTDAEERGLTFQMGYMLRANPGLQLLMRAVRENWLGKITEIDAMIGKHLETAARRKLSVLPGGGMFELGCHLIDFICCFMGKPAAVYAFSKPAGDDGFKDNQIALLEYPGTVATVRCNMADPFGFPRRRLAVTGTKGSMEVMPLEKGSITARLSEPHGNYPKGEQQITVAVPAGRYDDELTAFAAAIRGRQKLPWNAAHDISVHETVLRAAGVEPDK